RLLGIRLLRLEEFAPRVAVAADLDALLVQEDVVEGARRVGLDEAREAGEHEQRPLLVRLCRRPADREVGLALEPAIRPDARLAPGALGIVLLEEDADSRRVESDHGPRQRL